MKLHFTSRDCGIAYRFKDQERIFWSQVTEKKEQAVLNSITPGSTPKLLTCLHMSTFLTGGITILAVHQKNEVPIFEEHN